MDRSSLRWKSRCSNRLALGLGAVALAATLAACASNEPTLGSDEQLLTATVSYGAAADTHVSASAQGVNYGNELQLTVNKDNEALLRFDLSSIPTNAVIDRASLILTVTSGNGNARPRVTIRRITAAWDEATVTYSSFNQQFASEVSATLLPSGSSTKTVDVRALVQDWVAGTYPNHGLILVTPATPSQFIVSSEHSANRPTLEIQYISLSMTWLRLSACSWQSSCDARRWATRRGEATRTGIAC